MLVYPPRTRFLHHKLVDKDQAQALRAIALGFLEDNSTLSLFEQLIFACEAPESQSVRRAIVDRSGRMVQVWAYSVARTTCATTNTSHAQGAVKGNSVDYTTLANCNTLRLAILPRSDGAKPVVSRTTSIAL
jgi:hypothetical protein